MASGSKAAVYAAIGGNTLVMVAKFVGFALTGSGAMLSEGIHSLADVANQVLLAVGMDRSQRPADREHPFGYGRDAFVWSLMSAVGIFFVGCGVSVAHGVHSLLEDHAEVHLSQIGLWILGFSLLIEGGTLLVAVRSMAAEARARGIGFFANLRTTNDPFGVAVLLEDAAAVFGVILAFVAILLSQITHDPRWDAYGTIAVGVLLGLVAVFLARRNRTMLLGQAIPAAEQQLLVDLLESDPAIERVALTRAVVAGVNDYRVNAEIEFEGRYIADRFLEGRDLEDVAKRATDPEALRALLVDYGEAMLDQMGVEVDRIEAKIRERLPHARNIALEPDAGRRGRSSGGTLPP